MKKPIISLIFTGGWSDRLGGIQIDSTRDDQIHIAHSPGDALKILTEILLS